MNEITLQAYKDLLANLFLFEPMNDHTCDRLRNICAGVHDAAREDVIIIPNFYENSYKIVTWSGDVYHITNIGRSGVEFDSFAQGKL